MEYAGGRRKRTCEGSCQQPSEGRGTSFKTSGIRPGTGGMLYQASGQEDTGYTVLTGR